MQKEESEGSQEARKRKHSKGSSSESINDPIDPMIDPMSANSLDYPMAFFDPVTVSTHEKERRGRQTTNTLNDIYKHATRFEDIFIESPYQIDWKATGHVGDTDVTQAKLKVLRSVYDWFAAAVFDVEACQLALSEDEMAVSKNAMREATEYISEQLLKLRSINKDFQEKCYIFRTFIQTKPELAEELLKAMGAQKATRRPPPPKIAQKTDAAASGSATDVSPGAAQPPAGALLQNWRPIAKVIADALKKAQADGQTEFADLDEKFKQLQSTLEKQENLLKDSISKLKSKQDHVKELAEGNDRMLKRLKEKVGSIKSLPGDEGVKDEVMKLIEVELVRSATVVAAAAQLGPTASMKQLKPGDATPSGHSLNSPTASLTSAALTAAAAAAAPRQSLAAKKRGSISISKPHKKDK